MWNATNISRQLRGLTLSLLGDYKARIRIVYVEPSPDVLFAQNKSRQARVPEKVIRRMMHKWEVPDLTEAHQVDYVVPEQPCPWGS